MHPENTTMFKKTPPAVIAMLVGLLFGLLLTGPAAAQGDGNYLCVSAPTQIAKGDTEAVSIEIELTAGQPSGWTCTTLSEIADTMGAGISGARTNFVLEPVDSHEEAGMQNPGSNEFNWSLNAVGEEETTHNLIVFASVTDATRRTGYRSVASIPIRVTIKPPTGSVLDQIKGFLDGAKEILLVLTGLIVAAIALRVQIKNLLSGGSKPANGGGSAGAG
jgi:hypothetical protein